MRIKRIPITFTIQQTRENKHGVVVTVYRMHATCKSALGEFRASEEFTHQQATNLQKTIIFHEALIKAMGAEELDALRKMYVMRDSCTTFTTNYDWIERFALRTTALRFVPLLETANKIYDLVTSATVNGGNNE